MAAIDPANPKALRAEWEDLLGHPVSQADYEEIRDNLCAFFTLVNNWHLCDEKNRDNSDDQSPLTSEELTP